MAGRTRSLLPAGRRAAALFVVLSALPAAVHGEFRWNFPPPVTPLAHETLFVHNEFMIIITTLFVSVFSIMVWSMIRHRKQAGHAPATFTGPTSRLQWVAVSIPFLVLMFIDFALMGVPAVRATLAMQDTQTQADMVLKVTGMQWRWQYEYPDSGIRFLSNMTTPPDQIANRQAKGEHYLLEVDKPVVLPVGKKVRVLLTSTDVIHTWWVPQFGVKRDAIPGFLRETWVKIDHPGVYRGQCAELCGTGHAYMPIVVEAVSPEEYDAWVERQKVSMAAAAQGAERTWSKEELMARGKEVYARACVACHQENGQGIPPAFPPLAGSRAVNAPLLDAKGRIVKDGHVDRVLNGKANTAMAAFRDTLSDTELAAVITYERNSFGNRQGDMIQPAQIRALRGEKS